MNLHDKITDSIRLAQEDQKGSAALEFAIIVPMIMVPLWGASVEINEALVVSRKVNQVGETLVDMVSRNVSLTASKANILMQGSASLMIPYSTSNLKILLCDATITSSSRTVAWSAALNDTSLSTGSSLPVTLPTAIQTAGVDMIVVRVGYNFTPPFSDILQHITGKSTYSFTRYYYGRPRNSDTISSSDLATSTTSSSSSSSQTSVICSYFEEIGYIDAATWATNGAFAVKYLSPTTLRGYHFWGIPLVRWMRRNKVLLRFVWPFVKAWSDEMAHRMGHRKKGSLVGKLLLLIGIPICYFIGRKAKEQDWQSLWQDKQLSPAQVCEARSRRLVPQP